jgi:hypothetical protein
VALRPRLLPGVPLSRDGSYDLLVGTAAVKQVLAMVRYRTESGQRSFGWKSSPRPSSYIGPVLHLEPDGRRCVGILTPLGDDPLEVQPRRAEEVPAAAFHREHAREHGARRGDEPRRSKQEVTPEGSRVGNGRSSVACYS